MIYKKNVMVIGGDSFKSKDGRQFNKVDLLDFNPTSGKADAGTHFVDALPALLAEGKVGFGDIVTAAFSIEDLKSKPKLVDIVAVVKKSALPDDLGKEVI